MAIQAKSRLTFHQLVDGTTVSFVLGTSQGLTQVKSKDPVSYLPSYERDNQVITPYLSIPGQDGNQVNGTCTWYVNDIKVVSEQNGMSVGTNAPFALTLTRNLNTAITRIRCEYTYVDPATGLKSTLRSEVAISQVENAGTMIMAVIKPEDGLIFSTLGGQVKPLRFTGQMIRGGAEDTSNVEYGWLIQGTDGNFYPITSPNAPAGSGLPAGKKLFENWNRRTITVYSDAILNIGTLKVVCKDTDSASSTYNKTVQAVVSILDATDPFDILPDAKQGTNISRGNNHGLPVEIIVRQGYTPMADGFYTGKTLGFYRLTPSDSKDATFAPPQTDFEGWSIGGGEVKRKYLTDAGKNGTSDNRTVYIKNSHLFTMGGTTFEFFLDF